MASVASYAYRSDFPLDRAISFESRTNIMQCKAGKTRGFPRDVYMYAQWDLSGGIGCEALFWTRAVLLLMLKAAKCVHVLCMTDLCGE